MVLAYTGLRWGDVAALRVQRVDLTRRRFQVVEAVSDIGGELVWGAQNAVRRVGPAGFHPHEPRPTAASLTIASRTDAKVVQLMLDTRPRR